MSMTMNKNNQSMINRVKDPMSPAKIDSREPTAVKRDKNQ